MAVSYEIKSRNHNVQSAIPMRTEEPRRTLPRTLKSFLFTVGENAFAGLQSCLQYQLYKQETMNQVIAQQATSDYMTAVYPLDLFSV